MPPLPWSPGSPGEPLKPCTNNGYKHSDCRGINKLHALLTCALLAYVWSYLPGLPIYTKGKILWFFHRQRALTSLEKVAGIKTT